MANNALDVLIAELLGDVGKLHDEMKALQGVLPAMAEDTEQRLAGVVGALVAASDALKQQAETAVTATGAQLANKHKEEAAKLVRFYVDDVGRAAAQAAEQAVGEKLSAGIASLNAAASNAERAGQYMQRATLSSLRGYGFAIFGLALFGGLLGAVVTVGALRWVAPTALLSKADSDTYKSGQFIERAWPRLDAATQKVVTDATNQGTTGSSR